MKAANFFISCAFLLAIPMAAHAEFYGLSAGGVFPTNNLYRFDESPGITAGGFVDLDLGEGCVFRPRIDGACLLRKKEEEANTSYKRTFWGGGLSADYLYHFSGGRKGLFGLVGVGFYHLEAGLQGGVLNEKRKTNKIGGSFGVGYTFEDHWDATIRYGTCQQH